MNLGGRLAVVIITIAKIIAGNHLIGVMSEVNETIVTIIMMIMLTAAGRHPAVIIAGMKDEAIIVAAVVMIGEMPTEGEGVVATVEAAAEAKEEAGVLILDPCQEAAVALDLAHVT